jgi:copper(I)-binding protein
VIANVFAPQGRDTGNEPLSNRSRMMANARTWLVPLVWLSLAGLPATASSLGASSSALVAELAIVAAPPKGGDGDLEGYLVIWNGTSEEARLEAVLSGAFSHVRFVQPSTRSRDGVEEERSAVPIPGHSELVMLQRGIPMHLTPRDPISIGDRVSLDLAFRDGTVQTLSARVKGDREADDIHHHDPSNPEWLGKLDEAAARRTAN